MITQPRIDHSKEFNIQRCWISEKDSIWEINKAEDEWRNHAGDMALSYWRYWKEEGSFFYRLSTKPFKNCKSIMNP